MAVRPVPMPTTMPHSRMSCHTCVIASDASMPAEIRITAQTITARTPNRFMNAAANGPNNPNSMRRSASADDGGEEGDGDDDPAVVDVAALERRGEGGGHHGSVPIVDLGRSVIEHSVR